jgi:hypothetical protein
MDHFAGLDVSVKETSVCIGDVTGRILREVKAGLKFPASFGGQQRSIQQTAAVGNALSSAIGFHINTTFRDLR